MFRWSDFWNEEGMKLCTYSDPLTCLHSDVVSSWCTPEPPQSQSPTSVHASEGSVHLGYPSPHFQCISFRLLLTFASFLNSLSASQTLPSCLTHKSPRLGVTLPYPLLTLQHSYFFQPNVSRSGLPSLQGGQTFAGSRLYVTSIQILTPLMGIAGVGSRWQIVAVSAERWVRKLG